MLQTRALACFAGFWESVVNSFIALRIRLKTSLSDTGLSAFFEAEPEHLTGWVST